MCRHLSTIALRWWSTLVSFSILFFIVIGLSSHAAQAQLFEHIGANDPETEGWTLLESGDISFGPVTNDLGLGIDAWSIDNSIGKGRGNGTYDIFLTPTQEDDATTNGWTLRANLRVVDDGSAAEGGLLIGYRARKILWALRIGSQNDGDPILLVAGQNDNVGTFYPMEGAGNGYHSYEMQFNPTTGMVDVRFDGNHVTTFKPKNSPATSSPFIAFGDRSSFVNTHGHYSLVQFELGPPVPPGPGQDERCADYTGQALGLCTAAVSEGCFDSVESDECDDLTKNWNENCEDCPDMLPPWTVSPASCPCTFTADYFNELGYIPELSFYCDTGNEVNFFYTEFSVLTLSFQANLSRCVVHDRTTIAILESFFYDEEVGLACLTDLRNLADFLGIINGCQ